MNSHQLKFHGMSPTDNRWIIRGSGNGLVSNMRQAITWIKMPWSEPTIPLKAEIGGQGHYTNSFVHNFSPFSEFRKQCFPHIFHVHIWQVSPQPSCGDTCQIWSWFKRSSRHFCKIHSVLNGEGNELRFNDPHVCRTQHTLSQNKSQSVVIPDDICIVWFTIQQQLHQPSQNLLLPVAIYYGNQLLNGVSETSYD